MRVIPTGVGGFPGAGHALLYADGAVPQLDTVQLDSAHGPAALPSPTSRDHIRTHIRDLKSAKADHLL